MVGWMLYVAAQNASGVIAYYRYHSCSGNDIFVDIGNGKNDGIIA